MSVEKPVTRTPENHCTRTKPNPDEPYKVFVETPDQIIEAQAIVSCLRLDKNEDTTHSAVLIAGENLSTRELVEMVTKVVKAIDQNFPNFTMMLMLELACGD